MKTQSVDQKQHGFSYKLAAGVGVIVLGFGLAACGGSSDSSSTPSSESMPTTSIDGGDTDIATGKLPAGWPSDVPTPPNTSDVAGAGARGSFSAGFKGSGSVDSELGAYFDLLKSNGWTQDKTVNTGTKLTHWKKDNRTVQVMGQDQSDGTYVISVTVVTKNK